MTSSQIPLAYNHPSTAWEQGASTLSTKSPDTDIDENIAEALIGNTAGLWRRVPERRIRLSLRWPVPMPGWRACSLIRVVPGARPNKMTNYE